jgi:hypothetical protein
VVCDEKGNVMTIFVNKKEFTLVERGTKVWIVTRENQYYILKDSWVQSG